MRNLPLRARSGPRTHRIRGRRWLATAIAVPTAIATLMLATPAAGEPEPSEPPATVADPRPAEETDAGGSGEEAAEESTAPDEGNDDAADGSGQAGDDGAGATGEKQDGTGESEGKTDDEDESGPPARVAPAAASGPPEYEITGTWLNAPETIARGEPVVADWRVNVNDSEDPPGNDPVENVTVDFTLTSAYFDSIPDVCLTDGVETPSSISDDGTTLTCNLGTVRMGTAVAVQTPVVADGITGDEVTHDGTIDGQTVALPPIPIENDFRMDIYYGQNTDFVAWDNVGDPTQTVFDVQWTLRLGTGSDPGPESVTYELTIAAQDGSPVSVGTNPREGYDDESGCAPFRFNTADGHPWSDRPGFPERETSFVETCSLTQTGETTFELTLDGIDYSLLDVPPQDSAGNALPPDWNAIASGSLWLQVDTDEPGSINLQSDAPTYEAPSGLTTTDLTDNNTTNKSYTLPGSWAASWRRAFTGSGGTFWDDTYRVPAGTTVQQSTGNNVLGGSTEPDDVYRNCGVFDTDHVTYVPGGTELRGFTAGVGHQDLDFATGAYTYEWYTGPAPADPDQFDCGADPANWTTTEPTDGSTVQAVRVSFPYSRYAAENTERMILYSEVMIGPDVPTGQDVWMFGSAVKGNGEWQGPDNARVITPTPDARYPHTNGRRDILRVVSLVPTIEKAAQQPVVTPGVAADFTLTYAATGSALLPPTVDDYQIVDTLPTGMAYEPGSSDPEPEVSTNASGQQVLTWTLDGVPTNTEQELTYEAVADAGVEPGSRLTNVAVSSYDGVDSREASATVTVTTNGYTTILKTSDVEYIPNDEGDGVGTGSWTVAIESFDPVSQGFTDTIDILPYNGDSRGTSYSGSYRLTDVVLHDGGTVYYTDADPDTLTDDPADPANGAAGDPTGGSVGWTTIEPDDPTAIRVIGGELEPGEEFSFQVAIRTRGAQPEDVYWNSAQARAEHTELVMRTSAPLFVTAYEVQKSSKPKPGSEVEPGDVVEYAIEVNQVGEVPAGAWLTDDLSKVLDDADYNDDVEADLGVVSVSGDTLSWEGEIPVGGTATITYSVTVGDRIGDLKLRNVVTSPGCRSKDDCTTDHHIEPLESPDPKQQGSLPSTGGPGLLPLGLGLLLLLGGAGAIALRRRS